MQEKAFCVKLAEDKGDREAHLCIMHAHVGEKAHIGGHAPTSRENYARWPFRNARLGAYFEERLDLS